MVHCVIYTISVRSWRRNIRGRLLSLQSGNQTIGRVSPNSHCVSVNLSNREDSIVAILSSTWEVLSQSSVQCTFDHIIQEPTQGDILWIPFLYLFSFRSNRVYLSFGSISSSVGISAFHRSSAATVSRAWLCCSFNRSP